MKPAGGRDPSARQMRPESSTELMRSFPAIS